MLTGALLILIFLGMVVLMYLEKISALLAVPIMALLFAVVARVPLDYILHEILENGASRLSSAYLAAIFGGMLALFIKNQGIGERLVRFAAELAGSHPLGIGLTLMAVTGLLFSTLGGLGAVIMVGTIILPILLSLGVPPTISAGIMLIGISMGGCLNIGNWQLYMDLLKIPKAEVMKFELVVVGLHAVVGVLFAFFFLRRNKLLRYWTAEAEGGAQAKRAPAIALLTPIIPLAMVLIFDWPIVPAFIFGLVYALATTWRKNSLQIFTKSLFEGVESVAPAVILLIGIGMLLKAVTHANVANALQPYLQYIIPNSPMAYVAVFTVLAPLALYRGPLNIWGMGSGLATILLSTKALPPEAIMGVLISVGMIQGVCDPTNTHNVWIANYVSVEPTEIMKKLMPFIWMMTTAALAVAAVLFM